MRVGKVAGYINLVRLYFLQQLLHNMYVRLANGVLLDASRLVERKVEEMHMVQRDAVIRACRACLSPTYQPLYGQDVTRVDIAFLLLKQELLDVGIHLADGLVLILIKKLVETVDEVHEAYHLLIAYGNIARSLVCHMHVVTLLHQTADGAAHGYHIVIGMRRKDDHTLGERLGTLRTIRIIRIGLAAGPAGDGMLQVVEYLDVHIIGRAVKHQQLAQAVLVIILVGQLQNRFSGQKAKPHDGTPDQLVRPFAAGHKPRALDARQV